MYNKQQLLNIMWSDLLTVSLKKPQRNEKRKVVCFNIVLS
jgi:hypothetical protein